MVRLDGAGVDEAALLEAVVDLRLADRDATAKQLHEALLQKDGFADVSLSAVKRACSKMAKQGLLQAPGGRGGGGGRGSGGGRSGGRGGNDQPHTMLQKLQKSAQEFRSKEGGELWRDVAGRLVCEEFEATGDLSRDLFVLLDALIPDDKDYCRELFDLIVSHVMQAMRQRAPTPGRMGMVPFPAHVRSAERHWLNPQRRLGGDARTDKDYNWAFVIFEFALDDDDAETMEIARDEASGRLNFKRGEVAWMNGLLEKGLGAPDIKREILRKLFMLPWRKPRQDHAAAAAARHEDASRRGSLPERMVQATISGDVAAILDWLLTGGNVNATTADDKGMLHIAAEIGIARVIRALAVRGADLNIRWSAGIDFTPLMCAAKEGRPAAVEALIKLGADADLVCGQHPDGPGARGNALDFCKERAHLRRGHAEAAVLLQSHAHAASWRAHYGCEQELYSRFFGAWRDHTHKGGKAASFELARAEFFPDPALCARVLGAWRLYTRYAQWRAKNNESEDNDVPDIFRKRCEDQKDLTEFLIKLNPYILGKYTNREFIDELYDKLRIGSISDLSTILTDGRYTLVGMDRENATWVCREALRMNLDRFLATVPGSWATEKGQSLFHGGFHRPEDLVDLIDVKAREIRTQREFGRGVKFSLREVCLTADQAQILAKCAREHLPSAEKRREAEEARFDAWMDGY